MWTYNKKLVKGRFIKALFAYSRNSVSVYKKAGLKADLRSAQCVFSIHSFSRSVHPYFNLFLRYAFRNSYKLSITDRVKFSVWVTNILHQLNSIGFNRILANYISWTTDPLIPFYLLHYPQTLFDEFYTMYEVVSLHFDVTKYQGIFQACSKPHITRTCLFQCLQAYRERNVCRCNICEHITKSQPTFAAVESNHIWF